MSGWLPTRLFSRKGPTITGSEQTDVVQTDGNPNSVLGEQQGSASPSTSGATKPATGQAYGREGQGAVVVSGAPATGVNDPYMDKAPGVGAENENIAEEGEEDVLLDTDVLFTRLSVAEVRQYEKRLQGQMAAMRQTMQQVVGKHYPQLIDAADTVVAMDTQSAAVSMQLSRLRSMLEGAQNGAAEADAGSDDAGTEPAHRHLYAVAAQVKVLASTPEMIWKSLGAGRFLQAALMYIVAREIHRRLSECDFESDENVDGAADPLLAFPVIVHMWSTIEPLCAHILSKARAALQASGLEATSVDGAPPDDPGSTMRAEVCASAVCTMALLEGVDAEEACAVFLAQRTEGILQDSSLGLDKLLRRIQHALADYATVFSPSVSSEPHRASLVVAMLEEVCASDISDDNDNEGSKNDSGPVADAAQRWTGAQKTEMKRIRAHRRQLSLASGSINYRSNKGSGSGNGSGSNGIGGSSSSSSLMIPGTIVSRFLPLSVSRFRPPLPCMLDVYLEEDSGSSANSLASKAQSHIDRCARHVLREWWDSTRDQVNSLVAHNIEECILTIADATHMASTLRVFGTSSATPAGTNEGLPAVDSLYGAIVEPLLRQKVLDLLYLATESALCKASDFFASGEADVRSGHLAWQQPLREFNTSEELAEGLEDVDCQPAAVRVLSTEIRTALETAWVDGQVWWMQLSATNAAADVECCANHFESQWRKLAGCLAERASIEASKATSDELSVQRCLRGAWAITALVDVAQGVVATSVEPLCKQWARTGVDMSLLSDDLRRTRKQLLQPWLQWLGHTMASAWSAHFDALYLRVAPTLLADTTATRRDVISAWKQARGRSGMGGPQQYTALRRLASPTKQPPNGEAPSAAIKSMTSALRMRVQALGVLGAIVSESDIADAVGAAASKLLLDATARAQSQGRECCYDQKQLSIDAHFAVGPRLSEQICALQP
ncbi:hypothetical protein GGI07_005360 [Coemansia sp. Benny D115]|nr:hypothetical protein GGI07_005360 [Coemansia sp. Benny D115]